jgi:Lon protease-like protein
VERRYLPVFPLGSVLVPTQLLPLHIFEPRYRFLMETITEPGAPGEIGVVLIERGSEVGGGDIRVETGTVAHLIEADPLPDGRWVAVFAGSHRFKVHEWLPEDPFPAANVEEIPDREWDPRWLALLGQAESTVRQALTMAAELGESQARATFTLSTDPSVAAWQLCAVSPLGPFDRQRLLEADSHEERLTMLAEESEAMVQVLAFRLRGG